MSKKKYNTQNLTPWKPGQSGNPAGSAKIWDTTKRKFTANQILDSVYKFLKTPFKDLKKMSKDESITGIDLMIIRTILKGANTGNNTVLESFINRTVGKVKDQIDLSSSDGSFTITDEQKKKIAERILKEKNEKR